MSVHKVYEEE